MEPETRVVRAGLPEPVQNEPFRPGPVMTSTYAVAGDVTGPHVYGRNSNPTWTAYESAVGELDGGRALVFGSGMAAVSAVLLSLVEPGQTLLVPDDCYNATLALARRLPGLRLLTAPTTGLVAAAPEADVVWVETPSNPLLDLADLAALRAAAPGLLVADNTLMTALGQQPLLYGVDVVVCADTKLTSGHSDLLLGHVTTRDDALHDRVLEWRRLTGGIAGPHETWLAHRSLATLGLRHERVCANALAIAELLEARSLPVRYPGLAAHPQHDLATRQMRSYGGVLGLDLPDSASAQRFLAGCTLVDEATSFGTTHTTAERRARWGSDPISEGYVRLSAGLEATADLLADVAASLDAL
jgi:cystathionine gamma-lyase